MAHAIAMFGMAVASIITTDQQARELLVAVFKNHPTLAADILVFAGIVCRYSHSSSPEGTLATARKIIDAATTK